MKHNDWSAVPDGEEGFFCKDMSRSERRGHRERLKRARRWHWGFKDLSTGPASRWSRVVETPTVCSCPMCGNPRKWFGDLSIPERRFWQGWEDADGQ